MTGLSQVLREPILEASDYDGKGCLRDWGVRGFEEFQMEAFFHTRIINADVSSCCTTSTQILFADARVEKEKYGQIVVED